MRTAPIAAALAASGIISLSSHREIYDTLVIIDIGNKYHPQHKRDQHISFNRRSAPISSALYEDYQQREGPEEKQVNEGERHQFFQKIDPSSDTSRP